MSVQWDSVLEYVEGMRVRNVRVNGTAVERME
jgi:hypothetical protein